MAIVPTYTAEVGIPSGGTGPQANPAAFAAPARALGNLGETIAQTGSTVGQTIFAVAKDKMRQDEKAQLEAEKAQNEADRRKEQEDIFWAAEQNERYQESLTEFVSQNDTDQDLGEKYKKYAQKLSSEYQSTAPTVEAAKKFQLNALRSYTSLYGSALSKGETARFSKLLTSTKEGAVRIANIYNSGTPIGNEALIQDRIDSINSFNFSDETKRKLRSALVSDIAVGVADKHSWFSRKLIEGNEDVDAETQKRLLDSFDSIDRHATISSAVQFERQLDNTMGEAVFTGSTIERPDYTPYRKAFPDENGFFVWKNKLDDKIDLHNGKILITKGTLQYNPAVRNQIVNERWAKYPGTVKPELQKYVTEQLARFDEQFKDDPAGTLMSVDPDLVNLNKSYQAATTDEEKKSIFSSILERRWLLQGGPRGEPSPGDPDPNSYRYLPEAQQRILTKVEAKRYFDLFQNGNPQQRVKSVEILYNQMLGDERKFAVALKDIEQMNPGNSYIVQNLAVAHALQQQGRNDLVNLIVDPQKTVKSILNGDEKAEAALNDALNTSTPWKTFSQAARGSPEFGSEIMSGYREAVLRVAASKRKASKDAAKSDAAAIQNALDTVVGGQLHVVDVPASEVAGGYPMLIARYRLNKNGQIDRSLGERTPDMARFITSSLLEYARQIDPESIALVDSLKNNIYQRTVPNLYRDIKAEKNTPLDQSLDELRKSSMNQLRRHIFQNHIWVSDANNQGATLYLVGENGVPFAPRTKDKKPIHIDYSKFDNAKIPVSFGIEGTMGTMGVTW